MLARHRQRAIAVRIGTAVLIVIAACALSRADEVDPASDEFFELNIRPVLAGTCLACHDAEEATNSLRVDSREALLSGGDAGPAIVPGKPQESLLWRAIAHQAGDLEMPPDEPLPTETVRAFAAWITAGAAWPAEIDITEGDRAAAAHWAFRPVTDPTPPEDPTGWAEHPIDRFVAARQREQGLARQSPADPAALVRRLFFDVIGLPPTIEDVDAFMADHSPESWHRLVDRLLASPRFGERWGRHWMDVVRYADTAGDNADYPIPEAGRYRDYIIDAFNGDKPYDHFVAEQLAGDVLARRGPHDCYSERVTATGFIALSRRYATAPYELWHLTVEDTIDTTGRSFLGLTLRCARCHDHKYDPITTEDYYALYGMFDSTKYPYAGSEEFQSKGFGRSAFVPLMPPEEAEPLLAAYRGRMAELESAIDHTERDGATAQQIAMLDAQIANSGDEPDARTALEQRRDQLRGELQGRVGELRGELNRLKRAGLPDDLPGAYGAADAEPHDVAVQIGGEVDQIGAVVSRGAPAALCDGAPLQIAAGSSGRLELAEWLTRPDHPLTGRVMVNRIWQHYFGQGLVATPSNFGLRGARPTHPQLLDWLASRLVENGWSLKSIHRLILTSQTYRLGSGFDAGAAAIDPDNRLCWRHDRRRLEAEAIRDALLMVGGNLDRARPGPHPFPPVESWGWTQHNPFRAVYPSQHRSVYLMTQRIQRHPYLALFDGPDPNQSTARRTEATVPLQALYMMNNSFVHEQAQRMADRLLAATDDDRRRVELAHHWAWSRSPTPAELASGLQYVARNRQELVRLQTEPGKIEHDAWTGFARVMLMSNEFIYID